MKGKAAVSIGDAVMVKICHRVPDCDGIPAFTEHWLPATVCSVGPREISVAFSDGERLALPIHDSGRNWRYQ